MLLSFSVQNWKSFKNKATISAIASKQRLHRERVPKVKKYNTQILPILVVYGGNASGKTNLFDALYFARKFIMEGTKNVNDKINTSPFLLSSESRKEPSKFWFTFLAAECVYEFYFSITQDTVREEKLTKIMSTSEKVLYDRIYGKNDFRVSYTDTHLKNIQRSTRDNQLFLTKTIEDNKNSYKDVYDWFSECMMLISPEAKFAEPQYISDENHRLYEEANSLLNQLDTGISHLGSEKLDLDLEKLTKNKTNIDGDTALTLFENIIGRRLMKSSEEGKEVVNRVVSYHKCEDGNNVQFDIRQESAGTRRMIELLPAFMHEEIGTCGVYIIDEIDRSLHHLLVRNLIERFLNSCSKDTRMQIIFTTHDLLLMDQELFRRDEIYLMERDNYCSSAIIPLSDYKDLRSDKHIRKSYIQGRFGGIPRI